MNKRVGIIAAIVAILAIVAVVVALQLRSPASQVEIEYRLGVMIPETGNLAFIGQPIMGALILAEEATEEELAEEGIDIELVWMDTQGNPREAVTGFNRLVDVENVDGIMTTLSGVTSAVDPLAESRDLLFIGLTVEPTFLSESESEIRVFYSFKKQGELFADLIERNGWDEVLIFHSTDAATSYEVEEVVIPALEQKGVEVFKEEFNVGQRGFRDIVAKHASFDGDGIILHGFGSELPYLIEDVNNQPALAELPKYASLGSVDIQPALRERMAGVKFFAPAFAVEGAEGAFKQVLDEFASRFPDETFTYSAVYAYDAFLILAEALLQTGSKDPAVLREAMETPKEALSETYVFDEQGDYAPSVVLAEFGEDGSIRLAEDAAFQSMEAAQ